MALSNSYWIDGKIVDILKSDTGKSIYTVILEKRMKNHKKNAETKFEMAQLPITFWGRMGEECKNHLAIGMSITVNFYVRGNYTNRWYVQLIALTWLDGMNMKPKNEFLQKQREDYKANIIKKTEPKHNINNDFDNNTLFDAKPEKEEEFDPFN